MKYILLALILCLQALPSNAQPLLRQDNIDEVVSSMTLQEKLAVIVGGGQDFRVKGLPAGRTRPVERFGIPATYLADGPAGVRVNHPCTGFPTGTLLASSWDVALVEEVAAAMGEEAHEYGVDLLLAPGMNIHRNPLCGRNFEYFSEDPLLTGKLAAAYVKGVQSQGVGATVKHFAVNNQETSRTTVDALVGERALREIYLRGFEIAVKESSPWAVMASYNQLNGDYTQQKKSLLTGILREEWGFDGMVMTDWGRKQGTAKAVQAGNDLMEPGFPEEEERILAALEDGSLDIADVDRNVRRVLAYIVKTPSFKKYPCSEKPDLQSHKELSRRAAAESMVLLKNGGDLLPLASGRKISFVNLSGKEFVAGGTGSGSIAKGGVTAMETALEKAGFVLSDDADVVIALIGRSAGEEKDRTLADDYLLSAAEKAGLERLASSGKKVVVILNVCGAVETASWKALPDAILLAWAPGQQGTGAIADVLSGKASPSGRLPMTLLADYFDDPSSANFPYDSPKKVEKVNYAEGIFVGYRHFVTAGADVSYPFGYGLGYTSFKYSRPVVKRTAKGFEARVTVTNTGRRPGREVVQLYVSAPAGGLEKPSRELKGFAKTRLLAPGEKETLTIPIDLYSLSSYNEKTSSWETAKGKYNFLFAGNVNDIRAKKCMKLRKAVLFK